MTILVHKVRLQRWAERGLDPNETVIAEMAIAYAAGGWMPQPPETEPEC